VGNMLSITDTVGNKTSYGYDELNRRITNTNSLGKTRSYTYDAVGNQTAMTDRNGRQRSYSFDALDRMTAENWLNASGQVINTITKSYDAVGNVTATGDTSSRYAYTYDLIDRLTSVDNLGTPATPRVLLNYAYDAVGNLVSTTDTINGQLKGTLTRSYDSLDRLTTLTQTGSGVSDKRVDMAYDAASQMTGINRYSDLSGTNSVATSSYTYDLAGRLTKLDYKHGSTAINSFNYAYDAVNRLTQETSIDGTSNYNYDETDQLVNASHGNQANEAYTYDANGNRTNAGYGTGTNNQLLTDGKFNYQYDNEGNRTQKKEIATGEVTDYNWDERNRLTQITVKNAGGQVIKSIGYTYDVYNQRIAKVVDLDGDGSAPATTERFIYDDGQISLVFDGQGNQTHRYLYGENVDQILADETTAGVRWAVTDNQGTVTDVIDSQGQVLNHLVYDSFGKITSQSNPAVEFRYGYTGRELDTETGDYYYRARYYDANVGRFIGEDPLGFGAGDGNLNRYVGNSPTNYTDPSGEEPEDFWNRVDQSIAGAANTLTFGTTNRVREQLYGEIATQNHHGKFYEGGEVVGEVISYALPTGAVKGAQWSQRAVNIYNKARNINDRVQDLSERVGSINNILQGCGSFDDVRTLAGNSLNPLGHVGSIGDPRISNIAATGTQRWKNKFRKDGQPFEKPGPKRDGAHEQKIQEIIDQYSAPDFKHIGGGTKPERYVSTPDGIKPYRRTDVTFQNPDTLEEFHFNVGKSNRRGDPITREREALKDIRRQEVQIQFRRYGYED
jgi:RHS repeat-associated protein